VKQKSFFSDLQKKCAKNFEKEVDFSVQRYYILLKHILLWKGIGYD